MHLKRQTERFFFSTKVRNSCGKSESFFFSQSEIHTHIHAKHKFQLRSNDFISGWVVGCFKLHETLFAVAADLKFMAQVFALDTGNPQQPKRDNILAAIEKVYKAL